MLKQKTKAKGPFPHNLQAKPAIILKPREYRLPMPGLYGRHGCFDVMSGQLTKANLRMWRARLRLISGLTMLVFVISHLTSHWFLLISVEDAQSVLTVLMSPWHTSIGTGILVAAFVVHYSNALWSIYIRRSLRITGWELAQVTLGLCIPFLLMLHVAGTGIADRVLGVDIHYVNVFIGQWLREPWHAPLQIIALITVWIHACIGIHYWLRTKRWYATWRPAFFIYGLLLPTLALAGYISGGNQVLRDASADPDFVTSAATDAHVTAQAAAAADRIGTIGLTLAIGFTLLPFAARGVREFVYRRRKPPVLSHANGRSMPI